MVDSEHEQLRGHNMCFQSLCEEFSHSEEDQWKVHNLLTNAMSEGLVISEFQKEPRDHEDVLQKQRMIVFQ